LSAQLSKDILNDFQRGLEAWKNQNLRLHQNVEGVLEILETNLSMVITLTREFAHDVKVSMSSTFYARIFHTNFLPKPK